MKLISILAISIAVSGCVTQGSKPITLADGTKGQLATCGGTRNTWALCYEAATKICPAGFDIAEKEQFEHEGFVKRNLFFKCK